MHRLLLPFLALLLLTLTSCRAAPKAEAAAEYPVSTPARAPTSYEREYVGDVHAVQRAELRARTKGRIESVGADEGQPVKAGQVLFSISSKELQQELRRARAEVASAAAELKAAEFERTNTKMLFEKRVVSPAEMSQIDSKVLSLAAKLEETKAKEGQAAINLTYAEVRAPFAGVINRIERKAGNVVSDGDLLTTIANASEVFVYFRVSEPEYLAYTSSHDRDRGKEVSFRLANGELHSQTGTIDAVETEFDKGTGTIAFRARFPNRDGLLKHGSTGKVLLTTHLNDALAVPQKSTFEIQEHLYLYVVDAEGRAHARKIIPKIRLNGLFVVESGIGADERYVVEGIQTLKEGALIAQQGTAPPLEATR